MRMREGRSVDVSRAAQAPKELLTLKLAKHA